MTTDRDSSDSYVGVLRVKRAQHLARPLRGFTVT
ncbi:unnamed protein product, partial [Haemonchus placei]|uniref:DUF736 domain-containing protein n=1 Tax=Haemonchus placei TaxID=6290 RepID=A0A0N4VZX1_HAEPC